MKDNQKKNVSFSSYMEIMQRESTRNNMYDKNKATHLKKTPIKIKKEYDYFSNINYDKILEYDQQIKDSISDKITKVN